MLRNAGRVAGVAFAASLTMFCSLGLVAHQRDVAAWRAAATDTVTRLGEHLEHTFHDIGAALAAGHHAGPAHRRLPRLVEGVQLVVNDVLVAERRRNEQLPSFLSCAEQLHDGTMTGVVPYQTKPRLVLVICARVEDTAGVDESLSWLVGWVDTDALFAAAGLRALPEMGLDYRLVQLSSAGELVLEQSEARAWPEAVRHELAVPHGRWALDVAPRELESVNVSLIASVLALAMSTLVGLVAYRIGSQPSKLFSELQLARAHTSSLDSRLLEEFERRREAEERLRQEARYDELTELPNRSYFVERLTHSLEASGRGSTPATVLLFDVTRLRLVNDTMGREVGDQILQGIARRLQHRLSPEDILARVGSDQYAVLRFQVAEVEPTVRFVEDALDAIEQPFALAGTDVFVTCRVGVVVAAAGYERAEDVLRDATLALSQARADEGPRLSVFGHEMHARAVKLLEIETDLRRAVERDEMVAYYQPILSLSSGRIIGFETLARWQHPSRGIVSPADFIPIAEQTGLIIQIDRWNLAVAARQLAVWQRAFPRDVPLKMSANLAANEMSEPDIVDFVASVLDETGIDPQSFAIEVTESGVMKSPESAEKILKGLGELGVHLHLDDFGTGYSSLAYLHRFSFDLLKIDRAFVGRMTTDSKSHVLVNTVMALARALEMGVVAEGIETTEQLDELRSLQCEMGQGFLFSRPVPSDEIVVLLEDDPVW